MYTIFKYVLTFCVFGAVYAKTEDEFKAWFLELGMICSRDFPLAASDIALLQNHKMPNNDNAKCLMACIYRKAKWIDDTGLYDFDSALELTKTSDDPVKAENGRKLFETCKSVNEESVRDADKGCDRAALLFKCLTENAPKMGFQIKNFM